MYPPVFNKLFIAVYHIISEFAIQKVQHFQILVTTLLEKFADYDKIAMERRC